MSQSEVLNDKEPADGRISITQELIETVRFMGWKAWMATVLMAAACGGCCLYAIAAELPWLTVIRIVAAALAMMSAAVIDGKTKLIPNIISGSLFGAAAVVLAIEVVLAEDALAALIRSGLGLVICFLVLLLFSILSRGGFGMGDVKLVSALGFMMGLPCAMYTMLFGMIMCALTAAVLIIFKIKNIKDHIPFAPYIFIGYVICILIGRF